MCTNDKEIKSDECLICFESLLKDISFVHYVSSLPICLSCMHKLKMLNIHTTFEGVPLWILYDYNEFFRSLLYQYKGLYDYALKDVFLCLYKDELLRYCKNKIFVVAPSNEEDNLKRGFAPMYTIVKTISHHIFDGIYKKVNYKQSSLSYHERLNVLEKLGICHLELLKDQHVVIFDDVMTSGSTLKACIELVKQAKPCSIEVIVLSKKG